MLPQLPRIIFATAIGLILFDINTTVVRAQHFRGHTPYQDQFFNLDSTPRNGTVSAGGMYSTISGGTADGFASGMGTATCSGGSGLGSAGSGNGSCPFPTNAILRLRIDEDLRVEINGQPTKPQHLAGIHRGTRRFSLEGLEVDRVSPCDIVVYSCDEFGNPTRMVRTLLVQAGGHYVVHYPNGFEPLMVEQVERPILPTITSELGYPQGMMIENPVIIEPKHQHQL